MVFQLGCLQMKSYNYDDANADAEYMQNGDAMMAKVMNAIGEKGREQVINAFDDYDLQKLKDCIESECGMADFLDIMQKMLTVFKRISHGHKLIYKSIKASLKHGPLVEFIKELSEEHTLEIINALNAEEIGKLMTMGTDQVNIFELISIGKKIIPIIKKANGGKGLFKLMNMFTDDLDGTITLPYHHPVPGGLHPGISVYVQGTVPKNSNRALVYFKVDFACGQHSGADIPLHFNPRFNMNKVALNTFQSGRWGHEEGHQMPFQKGDLFEIIFIVNETGYQILVNKKPFCSYKHKIPPQSVKVIHVNGDLELNSLNVTKKTTTQNKALPYHQTSGLQPGMSVYVQGTVPNHSKRFEVNFVCGQHDGANIAFHFKIYFNWQKMVLNTFQAGRWGHEEHHEIPFQKGEDFEVIFIVKEAKYQILVNKKPFCIYMHRIPPQNVKVINVKGDVELQSLNVTERSMKESMLVPYTGDIPGGLEVNRNITVRGSIPKNAKRFQINFMAGQDIALHINPRMGERTVVRNSFLYGRWGVEERDLPFNPLQLGQIFELLIHCGNHKFKVYANGQHFFNYAHRYVPVEDIHTLEINGDVTLSYIKY